MKRKLLFLIALLVSSTMVWADDSGSCGDNLTWTLSGTALTISGTGAMTDYTGGGDWGTGITSVVINDGVTSIGEFAFANCTGLTSITIPESVTSIGGGAFSETAWYKNQPNGLVYAGKVAYIYKGKMPSDTSIVIQDGTLGIAECAFQICYGLTSITIPASVKTIGKFAFAECTGLTSITIPASVTSIGQYAFSECFSLASVNVWTATAPSLA